MQIFTISKLLLDAHVSQVPNMEDCIICFGPLAEDMWKCTTCTAVSHKKCIQSWIRAGGVCPQCRNFEKKSISNFLIKEWEPSAEKENFFKIVFDISKLNVRTIDTVDIFMEKTSTILFVLGKDSHVNVFTSVGTKISEWIASETPDAWAIVASTDSVFVMGASGIDCYSYTGIILDRVWINPDFRKDGEYSAYPSENALCMSFDTLSGNLLCSTTRYFATYTIGIAKKDEDGIWWPHALEFCSATHIFALLEDYVIACQKELLRVFSKPKGMDMPHDWNSMVHMYDIDIGDAVAHFIIAKERNTVCVILNSGKMVLLHICDI